MFYLIDTVNKKMLKESPQMKVIVNFIPEHFLTNTPGLMIAVDTNTASEIATIAYFRGKHEMASTLIHS